MADLRFSRVDPIGSPVAGSALLQELKMAVRMAGFSLSRRAEHCGHIAFSFHIRLLRKVQVAAVRLRLAGKGSLQILMSLRTIERSKRSSSSNTKSHYQRISIFPC